MLPDAFTCREAFAAGATARRLRARDLHHPFRGVRQKAAPPIVIADDEPLARDRRAHALVRRTAQAYATVMRDDAFFVGLTAVALLELPLPWRFDPTGPLCVAVPSPHRAPRAAGVHGHRHAATQVAAREHAGLRIAAPADLWASLAGTLSERELIVLGDAIVRVPRDSHGTAHPEQQLAAIARLEDAALRPGRRRRKKLLRALERVRVGSMSALETDFRLNAEDAGLPEPDLDVEIFGEFGRRVGIADAFYRRWRIVVEVEGKQHSTDDKQWRRDLDKYADYAAIGLELVRLGSQHIRGDPARGPAIVRAALARHGWRPGLSAVDPPDAEAARAAAE